MSKTRVPCILCGRELEDESAGNNQPVGALAFECRGHWPSAIFDHGGTDWLEINNCENSRATYKIWKWPR